MELMRVVIGICLGLYSVSGLQSCAAEERRMENQMDLTLGGNGPSLRGDLWKIDEAMGLVPKREPKREPKPEPKPDPKPEPTPEPKPAWRMVTLQEGETLWGLAEAHLGRGGRWRQIVRLNGWSEEDAPRLRAGTQVKLPRN